MNFDQAIQHLRTENARLKALLDAHGIPWQVDPPPPDDEAAQLIEIPSHHFSPTDKVTLFRRLFRGRSDVYPLRWESSKGGAGYAPACGNEWRPGVCQKPRIKCGDCPQRQLLPLTDRVLYDHLAGRHTIGVYPLLADDSCHFLALDFDEGEWRDDARAFLTVCRELAIPAALEISRSGNGAHVWIFFSEAVAAREARNLGAALISQTCARMRQLSLTSYDRLFPNQDTLPRGGFGNLIALPLQKQPRKQGRSLFVDSDFVPYPDQWGYLASIVPLSRDDLTGALLRSSAGHHPLDVAFVLEEVEREPWRQTAAPAELTGPLPKTLTLVLANQIFIAKADLPQSLANRLIRLAAFQNPEFYKAQAMRLPVWDKPRIVGCADNFPRHIGLPRGCLGAVLGLLEQHHIAVTLEDERTSGREIAIAFNGVLRSDQHAAVEAMLAHDVGVLCAPTAFGKTVTAAALIARRGVSTLILVHRTELLRQWQERLTSFLDLRKGMPGLIGGGTKKPSGTLDIAVMQSLSRQENLSALFDHYGQIIVDECHHLSAFSFETILKQAKTRYVVGLTATPFRRDGHQPIIFMQCGPIRHNAIHPERALTQLEVWPRYAPARNLPPRAEIQEIFRLLVGDPERNRRIGEDIRAAYRAGRKILVLTERTEHLEQLREQLGDEVEDCFVLHGRLKDKERKAVMTHLEALDETTPRILLATGRLIGEGFDHPALDTLVLAMPISWKGTLQQYAGRLHREHAAKTDVRIYDYVELEQPQLARMWEKRQRGYRAMGYAVKEGR